MLRFWPIVTDSAIEGTMAEHKIEISDSTIHIIHLEIHSKDVSDYLKAIPEGEREQSLVRAVEVGVFCIERTQTRQDTEFVRRQMDSLLLQFEKTSQSIPERVESALIGKVGVDEGQVLAPVKLIVNDTSKALLDKVNEVKILLSQEVDPTKETTTLGKALKSLREMLDPKRSDSVQGAIESALSRITTEDGTLAKAVKSVVTESVKPLADEVSKLSLEVRGQTSAEEALANTAVKGATYEEEVIVRLQEWAQSVGAEIEHVGSDNRPGDVLITFPITSFASTRIKTVIEIRDRHSPKGRKQISDDLSAAMAERTGTSGVYLSRNIHGLAKEIGEWSEGQCEQGPWIACTDEHLLTASRFLAAQERLEELRSTAPEVNASSIVAQAQRIRTALDRVKNINRYLTDVRSGADSIKDEAEKLRDEVRDALSTIEEAVRSSASKIERPGAA